MKKSLVSAAVAVALLAGCGSSGPSSAHALAAQITGCDGILSQTPAVMEITDVTCTLRNGAQVEIGTFANSNDEKQWISAGGSPESPDPAFAGCCIQGNDWAATVGWGNNVNTGNEAGFRKVISALGGRAVNG
jgi:hypothetical protein